MKIKDADLLAKLISESSRAPAVVPEGAKRSSKIDEQKMLRLRRMFDEKYSISTPRELMRI